MTFKIKRRKTIHTYLHMNMKYFKKKTMLHSFRGEKERFEEIFSGKFKMYCNGFNLTNS